MKQSGGNYSKHIYMGSQRIVSKLSNSGIFEDSPVTANDQQARYALQSHKIKERFDSLGVVYNGTAQTGGLISSIPDTTASSYFYHHPDHLGSSSLITDGTGALTQHIQYVPFGEVFVEERTNSWSTPYKFNGKELDEETGLYYYHARYFDPRLSVWMSVDPLAEKYFWTSSYVYCLNNPVKYTDPTGMEVEADAKSQINIINTLSKREHKYVRFDENGVLDSDRLNKSKSKSENMTALKTLANSERIYSFLVVDEYIDADGKVWDFKDDASKGTVGLTSVPNGLEAPSKDEKIYVLVSNKTDSRKQASTTAHEGYAHSFLFELSQIDNSINPWHKYGGIGTVDEYCDIFKKLIPVTIQGETNLLLKNRQEIVEKQALDNYDRNNRKR